MTRRDDPALYRAAERLRKSLWSAKSGREVLRLIREAMLDAGLLALYKAGLTCSCDTGYLCAGCAALGDKPYMLPRGRK